MFAKFLFIDTVVLACETETPHAVFNLDAVLDTFRGGGRGRRRRRRGAERLVFKTTELSVDANTVAAAFDFCGAFNTLPWRISGLNFTNRTALAR